MLEKNMSNNDDKNNCDLLKIKTNGFSFFHQMVNVNINVNSTYI